MTSICALLLQIKGAAKVFYGIHDVVDSETVIIVEGEMDKLALEEAGFRNCVSVPGQHHISMALCQCLHEPYFPECHCKPRGVAL